MTKTFTLERYGVPNHNNVIYTKESVDKAMEEAARQGVPVLLGYESTPGDVEVTRIIGAVSKYLGNGEVEVIFHDTFKTKEIANFRNLVEANVPLSFAGRWIGEVEETIDGATTKTAIIQSLESGHIVTSEELDG